MDIFCAFARAGLCDPTENPTVKHFGLHLKKLRTDRGMTQADLAEKAGVSELTVLKGEGAEKPTWRRSTITDVLQALHNRLPVAPAEGREFLKLAGMSEALLDAIDSLASDLSPPAKRWSTPDRETLHVWVDTLAAALGDRAVMSMLHGYAAGMQVELPPRVGAARPITPQSKSRSGT